jgi:hypothetical protein
MNENAINFRKAINSHFVRQAAQEDRKLFEALARGYKAKTFAREGLEDDAELLIRLSGG